MNLSAISLFNPRSGALPKLVAAVAAAASCSLDAGEIWADFEKPLQDIRPELHSSGWAPRSASRNVRNDDESIKAMNLCYARTHDWALVNPAQRVVDYQYIFPLFDKDPSDPSNYYFDATDHLLNLARGVGLKIFYRLGTSIEHTGKIHFNALVPADFDKTAEIFAGIVRHYNKGWANGKNWNIEYWEIWNEPDSNGHMWCLPEDDYSHESWLKMNAKYRKFFIICLKRLKSEFPEIKVGGPALCWMNQDYFRELLSDCKAAGVTPDFISWHGYVADPSQLILSANQARALCDSFGFDKCELILNEWHYLLSWEGLHKNVTPALAHRAHDGPTGLNNIDSAAFTLSALAQFQTSPLSQAHFYGCAHTGNWGYMDAYNAYNKNYYACVLFGKIVKDFKTICASANAQGTIATLAVKSQDGARAGLLVVDYRGAEQVLTVDVKGLGNVKRVSGIVLDETRDNLPCETRWHDGTLTLVKSGKTSAAFFVTFDL